MEKCLSEKQAVIERLLICSKVTEPLKTVPPYKVIKSDGETKMVNLTEPTILIQKCSSRAMTSGRGGKTLNNQSALWLLVKRP